MFTKLDFKVHKNNLVYTEKVTINNLLCIGYAGRNQKKVEEHIKELEAIGVPSPKSIPEIYHLGTYLINTTRKLDVVGNKSSGEVEFTLLFQNGKIFVGIASDHTDRELETVSIIKSKQICQKPIDANVWDYEDVKDHWDELILRSWIEMDGQKKLYQEGSVAAILPIGIIVEIINKELNGLTEGVLVLSGTVPLLEGFRFGDRFSAEMEDPILKRKLSLEYMVNIISK